MLTKLFILLVMLPFCAVFLVVLYGIRKLGDILGVGNGHDTSSDGGTSGRSDCGNDASGSDGCSS
ncbi:hypothetical protein [Methylobacterium sp. WL9]|uniref:hypothetical protein n=1 Tax=Methylobacterium sp. WL9 TaxID=2603898 RepID=UPI00165015DE|nr:hypothetical protein [Methylobacterium sp. WL9]